MKIIRTNLRTGAQLDIPSTRTATGAVCFLCPHCFQPMDRVDATDTWENSSCPCWGAPGDGLDTRQVVVHARQEMEDAFRATMAADRAARQAELERSAAEAEAKWADADAALRYILVSAHVGHMIPGGMHQRRGKKARRALREAVSAGADFRASLAAATTFFHA